ncbi:hypothetical protein, conserved [Leishmania donovani]|uniref:Uncharacterized protein n=1 Tax=Leishmania donovani TaxID=5661 RepID=A0A3Q8IE24_LEIDO|nr:hypothetical protein, conserved [Leishmania donovani]AYU78661.1 hypothetical protein LdCL_210025300 [Leishmania donovani]TPP49411.1 hypothetical protein CGC21_34595 [Leishmania donovani]CBZ34008.1 hypothetical protein, conserved [Leishmania donovani]
MSASQQRRPLTAEERARSLEVLADLLVSTFDGEVNTADVHRALSTSDTADGDGDDSWRVRIMECAHERNARVAGEAAQRGSREWVCPMCETVNWIVDARETLRKRQGESSFGFSLTVTDHLRCECCGYDGATAPS